MKNTTLFIFTVILFILPVTVYSQSLNFDKLKKITQVSLYENDAFLEIKGYHINNDKENEPVENGIKYIWDKDGNPSKTLSFIKISESEDTQSKMVFYQFYDRSHFNKLKKQIENSGIKLRDSFSKMNNLYFDYELTGGYQIMLIKGDNKYVCAVTRFSEIVALHE